ncbi:hypothetical protein [Streptomyces sp. ST2-7A]|uniref:hypothetical protein n=1 Tax=Streptomyces sp. ST2-7A TaxID=2907214 RepID=UPI001F356B05|nr:hypothetical protein [Streptomyces sp. ST2-7A]MCE7081527.1 hypothetical protein [Streptomyces sp. ST2-7A]
MTEKEIIAPEGGGAPRRRHWPAVTAVAAAVALVAGAVWAGSGALGDGDGTTATAPLVLNGPLARGIADAAAAEHATMPGWDGVPGGGYIADGDLPEGPANGRVHRFEGEVPRERVVELAGLLGVAGDPVDRDDHWAVGGGEPGDPTLVVERAAPGTWTFHTHGFPEEPMPLPEEVDLVMPSPVDPDTPVDNGSVNDGGGSEGRHGGEDSAPDGEWDDDGFGLGSAPRTPAEPVDEKEAMAAARPVLEALGLGDAEPDAGTAFGENRTVRVSPTIGDLRILNWDTLVEIGPGGTPVAGSGTLLKAAPAEEYPLLNAEGTLDLLNETVGGETAPSSGLSEEGSRGAEEPVTDAVPAAPGDPDGMPGEVPPVAATDDGTLETLLVVDAEPILAPYLTGDAPVLVPSWLFTVESPDGSGLGFPVSHPAVHPDHIDDTGRGGGPGSGEAVGPPAGGPGSGPETGVGSLDPGVAPGGGADDDPGKGSTGAPRDPDPETGLYPPGDMSAGGGGDRSGDPMAGAPHVSADPKDPRSLIHRHWWGVCGEYRILVEETPESVTLRVEAEPSDDPEAVCVMIAVPVADRVPLEEPLGDRVVFDGEGRELPRR